MYQGKDWIFPLRADAGSLPPRLDELVLRSDPEPDRPGSLLSRPPTPLQSTEVGEVVIVTGASVFLGDRLSWLRETLLGPDWMLPLRLLHGWIPFGVLIISLKIPLFGSVGETGELAGKVNG